ncbi:anti-sigma factor family protein [Streptomyces sp. NPDC088789]|uniref:anti-sigma factor family protein n=1 Tax=Streptomyces sp. NPDC088789 TaxID=3365899 RepID=UPI0038276B88
MTSTTDLTGHPDVTEIADLTEGLLSSSRTAEVREHLETCELCADVHASLEEVRGLLGTMPGPVGMPTDVADRIDAALAAEPFPPGVHDDDALVSRETEGGARTPHDLDDGVRVSRETSVAADRPAGRARVSTSGPGRKAHDRARRRRVTVIGAAFAAAAVGLGSVLLSTLTNGETSTPGNGERSTAVADTFSSGTLERQVADLLTVPETASTLGTERTPKDDLGVEGEADPPRVLQEPSVPDCVREGIGRDDPALAVDEGVYQGTEAMLVVLSDPSDARRVTAYIMDSTCIKRSSTAIAEILLQTSYAHP